MKLFRKATKYECEVAPKARILWLTVLGDDDIVSSKILVFHVPFKRWTKHINPWSLGPQEGWCSPVLGIKYSYIRRKFSYIMFWEPTDV